MLQNKEKQFKNVSISNIKIAEIKKEVEQKRFDEKEYQKFCKKYKRTNFENLNIQNLKRICDIGNGLLDEYFIIIEKEKDKNIISDKNIIIKMQYIVNLVTYTIMNKQNVEIFNKNKSLNEELKKSISELNDLKRESSRKTLEIKQLKNDMRSIITTIISIILAISIIPTAIAGIEHINANYILPFLSSIVLFGMIMIAFIYSMYQEKLKISTWVILIVAIILTGTLWWNSISNQIFINKMEKTSIENVTSNVIENEIDKSKPST